MKILLSGSSGFLGSLLTSYLSKEYDFICPKRVDLDLYQPLLVRDYLLAQDFDICLHLAANGATKDCEEKAELTHRLNTETTIEFAKVCKEKKARLVFFSTEQVFNDQKNAPFTETDIPKTTTNYGRQKIEAEEFIIKNMDDYLILRLSWQFGLASKGIRISANIIKNVLSAVMYRKPSLFTVHEYRCMTYAYNLVESFSAILNSPSGIVHFASNNTMTTYESAKYIAQQLNFPQEDIDKYILPDLKRYNDNPRDYRLDNTKALSLGYQLQSFEEDVKQCLSDFAYL